MKKSKRKIIYLDKKDRHIILKKENRIATYKIHIL